MTTYLSSLIEIVPGKFITVKITVKEKLIAKLVAISTVIANLSAILQTS